MKRLRGVGALVGDAVEHGSKAVEEIQKATAARTFRILEAIPPIAAPVRVVHAVHDLSVSGVHGMVRLVNRAVGRTIDLALDVAEASSDAGADAAAPTDDTPSG